MPMRSAAMAAYSAARARLGSVSRASGRRTSMGRPVSSPATGSPE